MAQACNLLQYKTVYYWNVNPGASAYLSLGMPGEPEGGSGGKEEHEEYEVQEDRGADPAAHPGKEEEEGAEPQAEPARLLPPVLKQPAVCLKARRCMHELLQNHYNVMENGSVKNLQTPSWIAVNRLIVSTWF